MAQSAIKQDCLEAEPPRLTALLKLAEDRAVETAKFLREYKARLVQRCGKASVEDALRLADLVAALAARAQKVDAEHAIEYLSSIEVFLDELEGRFDVLFASTK